ncbi:MAG: SapC family protein [Burkholderiales bacterium]|uniref:SapC family protein n=1 Tax=Inhella sp. TaxID=1921806 RepID=UPI001AC98BEC|nr:SapC family protein [Burkholderiales bacterium]
MKFPPMYRTLVPLDRVAHRELRMRTDWTQLGQAVGMNSVFLNAVEFAEACREFPIVFVRTGETKDGQAAPLAPLAVMGLLSGENNFINSEKRFTGEYAPAYLRRYPFSMARLDESDESLVICIDEQWEAFGKEAGERLFDDQGEPTELLKNLVKFLETYEAEVERTRKVCAMLDESGVLEPMRFEATVDGQPKVEVEGFLAVNHDKLMQLPDAKVVEFHRAGLLQLLEMHRMSMSNMGRLANKRVQAA